MVAVSVLLPTYNGERFLPAAIQSVLDQTFTDFELIIVDDQSSDRSYAIAKEFAERDQRVRLVRNDQNLGLFENYNRCLDMAGGALIKPFAQDDILFPDMLKNLVRAFELNPQVALLSTAKCWLGENSEILQEIKQFPNDVILTGKEVIRYNMIQLSNWVGEPSTVMFRAEFKSTGFDTTLFHYGDIDYWFRVVENASYLYISEPLCAFRRHGKSATTRNHFGLYFALDIIRMGHKYEHYLSEIGETKEHFTKRALETIALQIDHLVRNEALDLDKCLSARPRTTAIDEAVAFKELSYNASRYITELLSKISALEHQMADERLNFERQLNEFTNSTSWKITAPVRTLASLRGTRS